MKIRTEAKKFTRKDKLFGSFYTISILLMLLFLLLQLITRFGANRNRFFAQTIQSTLAPATNDRTCAPVYCPPMNESNSTHLVKEYQNQPKINQKKQNSEIRQFSTHNCVFTNIHFQKPNSHSVSCMLNNVCLDVKSAEIVVFEDENHRKPFYFSEKLSYESNLDIPVELEYNTDVSWLKDEWKEPFKFQKLVKFIGSRQDYILRRNISNENILSLEEEDNIILEQIDGKNIGHILIDDIYSIFLTLKHFQRQKSIIKESNGMNVLFTQSCDNEILMRRSCHGKQVRCVPFVKYIPICQKFHEFFHPILQDSGKIMFLDEFHSKNQKNQLDLVCFNNNLFVGSGEFSIHNWDRAKYLYGATAMLYEYIQWYKKLLDKRISNSAQGLKKLSYFPENGKNNLLFVIKQEKHRSGCSNGELVQKLNEVYAKDSRVNLMAVQYSSYPINEQFRLTGEVDIMVASRGAASVMGLFLKNKAQLIILDGAFKLEGYYWTHVSHVNRQWCFGCCEFSEETLKKAQNLIENALKNL